MKIFTILERDIKYRILGIIFWLIFWQLGASLVSNDILLASPYSTFCRLRELVFEGEFWRSLFLSSLKINLGFFMALFIASGLGILASINIGLYSLINPFINVVKSVPVVSFIILALIWIPSKNLSIFIAFLMGLPIIYTNVLNGINSIPSEIKDMTKVYKLSFYKKIRYIYISELGPYIKSAASLGLGLCWKSGIAAEVIGLPKNSIGENLYKAKIYLDTKDLFAWTITIVIISVLSQKILMKLIGHIFGKLEIR